MPSQLPESVNQFLTAPALETTTHASAFLDLQRLNKISILRKRLGLNLHAYCQSCVDFAETLLRYEMRGDRIDVFQLADKKRKAVNFGRVQPMLPLRRFANRKDVYFPPNTNCVRGLEVNASLIGEYYITLPSEQEDLPENLPEDERRKLEDENELFYSYVPHKIVTQLVYWGTLYACHVAAGRKLMIYSTKERKYTHAYTFAHK